MDEVTKELGPSATKFLLPKGGLLLCRLSGEIVSSLGFVAVDSRTCMIMSFHESKIEIDRTLIIEKVLAQAVKSKFEIATLGEFSEFEWSAHFDDIGFINGERRLVCDAKKELLPYLDWEGRLLNQAFGKGSETLNAQLYAWVSARIPEDEIFSELQLNKFLGKLHLYNDASALRRELVDRGFLARTRDCTKYWKVKNPDIIGRL